MADTQRDLASILALFADNSAGKITPQMLRDFAVSMLGGYAWIYVENGAAPQTVNQLASQLVGFTVNGTPSNGPTPDAGNDRITVGVAGDYFAHCSFSMSGPAGRTVQLQLRKNGAAVPGVRGRAKFDAAGDLLDVSFIGPVTCAVNDQLTVFAAADADGTAITLVDAAFSIRRVG